MIRNQIGIIGTGSWGTALAITMSNTSTKIVMWGRDAATVAAINSTNTNLKYLPYAKLPSNITAVTELEHLLQSDVIIVTIPSQTIRSICQQLAKIGLSKSIPLVLCAKGIEQNSLMLMSEVVDNILPEQQTAILSGPNFADEIAKGLPAAATLSARDRELAASLAKSLGNKLFRLYYSDDIIGAQIGGATKNVLAIACGIIIGRKMGENAKAALMTRGIAEIKRLCLAKGGKTETLLGLSGLGDIILTCNSTKSRNTNLGIEIGKSNDLEAVLNKQTKIVEGLTSAKPLYELSRSLKVEMPIAAAVYEVLHQNADLDKTIDNLLNRPMLHE